jgi:hypothetical protein
MHTSFLTWCNHICQFLFPEPLEFYSESPSLYVYLVFPLFSSVVWKFQVLHWCAWSILNWLFRQREIGIWFQSSVCAYSIFPTTLAEVTVISPTCFCHFCGDLDGCTWMHLHLSPLFFSIGLCVFFVCQYHAIFVTMAL